jgi:hypothetical protein
VVGFDDLPASAFYNPPLTTVQQQLEMQGSLGAEIIEESIRATVEKRAVVAKHRKVSPKLMVRDSTCPAPAVLNCDAREQGRPGSDLLKPFANARFKTENA